MVKRKAYPESHGGRRADAGSACSCSNTFHVRYGLPAEREPQHPGDIFK